METSRKQTTRTTNDKIGRRDPRRHAKNKYHGLKKKTEEPKRIEENKTEKIEGGKHNSLYRKKEIEMRREE